ncbi:hypothetical protein N9V96_01945 [Polaribacter sp.]|nr:hypothetical protein [Polaribacter sp.]
MGDLKLKQHCILCEYQKKDLEKGLYCGVTNEEPNFIKVCYKINLNKTFKRKIEKINLEYQKLIKKRFDVYGGIVLFPIMGCLIFFFDYLFYKKYYAPYSMSVLGFAVIAIIFLVGIIFIAKGTGPLISCNQQKEIIHKNKADLDRICKLYGFEYNIEFEKSKNFFEQNLYVKKLTVKNSQTININFDS